MNGGDPTCHYVNCAAAQLPTKAVVQSLGQEHRADAIVLVPVLLASLPMQASQLVSVCYQLLPLNRQHHVELLLLSVVQNECYDK